MTRECHVRFCKRLGVRFPRPTYQVTPTYARFVRYRYKIAPLRLEEGPIER